MSISLADVLHVAALARLQLGEEEARRLAGELAAVLGHMEALRRATGDDAGPAEGGEASAAPLREDRVAFDPLNRPPAGVAPEWADGFFVVPRLAALDADAARSAGEP